jgi:hypothetical protein
MTRARRITRCMKVSEYGRSVRQLDDSRSNVTLTPGDGLSFPVGISVPKSSSEALRQTAVENGRCTDMCLGSARIQPALEVTATTERKVI